MLRALLRKEWTQLRALRWVGFGLGALLPLFLLAYAEAASRGWTPHGLQSGYTVRGLFMDALPIMMIGLWGLLSLLFCSQAFAGDRAAGMEQFLLERPVPRSRIWRARLLAAFGSLVLLIICHLLLWSAIVKLTADHPLGDWLHSLSVMATFGGITVALGFTGGVAAAAFVNSPIQAVLMGIVFAIVPFGLSSMLGGLFPLAAVARVPVGLLIPWLLPLAYLLASFLMASRGEPAGRGRIKRGAFVLALSLLAIPALFLILAPLAVRTNAGRLGAGASPIVSAKGPAVCMIDYSWGASSGWLIDLEEKRRLRFLPPPVWEAAWNEDGTKLAVLHQAGGLGRIRPGMILDILDPRGRRLVESIALDWLDDLRWSEGELVGRGARRGGRSTLLLISSRTGRARRVHLQESSRRLSIIGPTEDGHLYVYLLVDEQEMRNALYRLDVEGAELDPEPLLVEEGYPTYSGKWISPSGRYWLRYLGQAKEGMRLSNLQTGDAYDLPECRRALWMAGDEIVCLEESASGVSLSIGRPGEEREEIRAWQEDRATMEVSPDSRQLLIQIWRRAEGDEGGYFAQGTWWKKGAQLTELWLFDLESRSMDDLTARLGDRQKSRGAVIRWAGAGTLALTGPGSLALADIEGDDEWRYLVGKP
jgi:ABC-type transport system involved in multi-copper enzyme maturation permease subunit